LGDVVCDGTPMTRIERIFADFLLLVVRVAGRNSTRMRRMEQIFADFLEIGCFIGAVHTRI
jgi:hypothetical protein